jgi:hypothetical protein
MDRFLAIENPIHITAMSKTEIPAFGSIEDEKNISRALAEGSQ